MAKRRYKPEQIVTLLRQIEVEVVNGKTTPQACKEGVCVKIDDPKMYTKPWIALDKLPFYARSADFDVREMMCSPSELAEYNKFIGDPELPSGGKAK